MLPSAMKKRRLNPVECMCKEPRQRRGEARVAGLLTSAREEFSARGYEAATMSSIARRAGASIGSLYQFFANKEAIARSLRTLQIMDAEELWKGLDAPAASRDLHAFVEEFVRMMIVFVDDHPAFLPLLDAPSSTQPVGARNRLRQKMEALLAALCPERDAAVLTRMAEVILSINKTMMGLYARSRGTDRAWIASEYAGMLEAYLGRVAVSLETKQRKRPSRTGKRPASEAGERNRV